MVDNGFAQVSEVRMPDWPQSPHLEPPAEDAPRGELDTFQFRSEVLDNARQIQVWRPPGYGSDPETRYPVLVVNHGDNLLRGGLMRNTLDNLVGKEVAPLVAVFVPRTSGPEYGGEQVDDYVRFLVDELLPHVDRHYLTDGENRAIMGPGSAGVTAVYAALQRADVFQRAAAQSFYPIEPSYERIEEMISAADRRPELIALVWSTRDYELGEGQTAEAASQGASRAAARQEHSSARADQRLQPGLGRLARAAGRPVGGALPDGVRGGRVAALVGAGVRLGVRRSRTGSGIKPPGSRGEDMKTRTTVEVGTTCPVPGRSLRGSAGLFLLVALLTSSCQLEPGDAEGPAAREESPPVQPAQRSLAQGQVVELAAGSPLLQAGTLEDYTRWLSAALPTDVTPDSVGLVCETDEVGFYCACDGEACAEHLAYLCAAHGSATFSGQNAAGRSSCHFPVLPGELQSVIRNPPTCSLNPCHGSSFCRLGFQCTLYGGLSWCCAVSPEHFFETGLPARRPAPFPPPVPPTEIEITRVPESATLFSAGSLEETLFYLNAGPEGEATCELNDSGGYSCTCLDEGCYGRLQAICFAENGAILEQPDIIGRSRCIFPFPPDQLASYLSGPPTCEVDACRPTDKTCPGGLTCCEYNRRLWCCLIKPL